MPPAVALIVVLAIGAGAILFLGSNRPRPEPQKKAPPPVDGRSVWQGLREKAFQEAPMDVARRMQLRSFRLLHGPSEPMPRSIRNQIGRSIGALPGEFEFEFTQQIPGTGGLWVVGGRNLTCVAYNGGMQTACDTATRAAKRGLALGVVDAAQPGARPADYLVVGLAPDRIREARVRVGGAERRIPVENNAYLIRAKKRIVLERLEPSS